jgi:hypothetical protein
MNTQPTPKTDAENDLQCELAAWELLKEATRERDEAREILREIRDNEVNPEDEADRFLRDHAPSELSKVREQRDRLAEEIKQLKSRLTQTMGAVTISRNGYVQEMEQQRDRLAEALARTRNMIQTHPEAAESCATEALQSLTPND